MTTRQAGARPAGPDRTVVVTGATGLQGGAVTVHLLRSGWHVRALTRRPDRARARALAALGAEVVRADMEDPASLRSAFDGAYGVYCVQNPVPGGVALEIRQGRNVGDVAKAAGVRHVVYASAGTGAPGTGVPSWESKLQVEAHMERLGLPVTVLRPMAFMELMTEKRFFPAASTWHIMPKLMGGDRKVLWLAVDDLGAIAASVFADPAFIGRDLALATDAQSIDECRGIYRDVVGRGPPRFPMPVWLFARMGFVGSDLCTMWRWLRTARLDADLETARTIRPDAASVRSWLARHQAAESPSQGALHS